MRRADRLFLIVNALRGRRRARPARRLAEDLGVSLRTIYRDIEDLQRAGMPIEGEAGVGYTLRQGSDVPPLMFTRAELEALVVGVRFAQAFAGERVARAAGQALVKVEAVLPEDLRQRGERSRILAPRGARQAQVRALVDLLHAAIDARQALRFDYARADGAQAPRTVEPLCLAFWGSVWTLGAWCRLRQDFRNFRLDRMQAVRNLGATFEERPERGLARYLALMGADSEFEP